jgi:signal transduction histidine kinase
MAKDPQPARQKKTRQKLQSRNLAAKQVSANVADREANPVRQDHFQELVENALVGISIIDGGQFIYMNTEQQRIFRRHQELVGLEDLLIYHQDRMKFEQVCAAIHSKKPLKKDVEFRFYPNIEDKQKQELRHVVVRTDLIRHRSKTMMLVNMVDITHSKRMEHLALLRSKMVSLGHISVGIAHEIRSPLTGINLLIEGIRETVAANGSKEEVVNLLDQVSKATTKIAGVVQRVLDYAKPSEPQVKPGNINQSILAAVGLAETVLHKANIRLETQLTQELSPLYLDYNLMEQVFLNLINNAISALEKCDGTRIIEICSSQQGNDIVITVSDSGEGIPEQLREKIFDPFFSTRKSGTGIGLSICQRIVTDHGGMISINTSPYQGAQFTIRLPIEKRQFIR